MQPMKSGKEKVCTGKSDYRLDRTVDFPVKALGRVLDEFCCQYGKYFCASLSRRETVVPILNLTCLNVDVLQNKDSHCTGH